MPLKDIVPDFLHEVLLLFGGVRIAVACEVFQFSAQHAQTVHTSFKSECNPKQIGLS